MKRCFAKGGILKTKEIGMLDAINKEFCILRPGEVLILEDSTRVTVSCECKIPDQLLLKGKK